MVILTTIWKDYKSRKNLCTKNFTYTNYRRKFIKNLLSEKRKENKTKKIKKSKPNNRDLNRDWIIIIIIIIIKINSKINKINNSSNSDNRKNW